MKMLILTEKIFTTFLNDLRLVQEKCEKSQKPAFHLLFSQRDQIEPPSVLMVKTTKVFVTESYQQVCTSTEISILYYSENIQKQ